MDFDFLDGLLDIPDATEDGLQQYTELAIKISQAKEDPQGYIEKNYNVVNRFEYNGEEYLTIRYKGILAHVSGNKIMEKFDIIDEITDETYYKDTTIEKIQKMCKTLKQLLKTNKLKHVDTKGDGIKFFGRTDILDLIEESFYKKRMRSVILVGKAGCGKTKIVQRLASKLRNKYVFLEWSIAETISNTTTRGALEGRVQRLLQDVYEYNKNNEKKIILFVDEIHCIMGGLSTDDSCQSVTIQDMLKPYLTKPNMIIIGATTPEEYKKSIYMDKAFRRRLNPIFIEQPPKDVIIEILTQFSENQIEDVLIDYIYEESKKIKDASNPDISIEIIDRLLAKKKMRNIEITKDIIDSVINIMKANENSELEMEED